MFPRHRCDVHETPYRGKRIVRSVALSLLIRLFGSEVELLKSHQDDVDPKTVQQLRQEMAQRLATLLLSLVD